MPERQQDLAAEVTAVTRQESGQIVAQAFSEAGKGQDPPNTSLS